MPKFRKKPIVIEAVQFTPEMDREESLMPPGVKWKSRSKNEPLRPVCETSGGDMQVSVWDWVIKGVKGEFYPCKPDIFEAIYEPVD